MLDRYTVRARRVVCIAEALARASGRPQAGTGHLLTAMMYEHDSAAWGALTSLGLTTPAVADAVSAILAAAPPAPPAGNQPMSPRLHTVLQDAASEALRLSCTCVSTGHLLLATARDPGTGDCSTAVAALLRLGIDPATVRDRMHAIMNGTAGGGGDREQDEPGAAAERREILARIDALDRRLAAHALNAGRRLGNVEEQLHEHMGDTLEVRQKLGLADLRVVESDQ